MAEQPNWEAANEETDAKDVEDLVQQPESTDNYVRVDILVPELLTKPRKLERVKGKLRKNYDVSVVIEHPADCLGRDVIRVEGYNLNRDEVLSLFQQYDSGASFDN